MHGFACRNSVHLVWRRRLLLALTAFGVFAVLSVLAPARSRPGLPMSPIWVRLGRPAVIGRAGLAQQKERRVTDV
jgi:hypothetical protein